MSEIEHPSRDELFAYLAGTLSEDAAETVGGHLDSCDACRAQLAELDKFPDRSIAKLRDGNGEAAYADRPQCRKGLERVQAVICDGLEVTKELSGEVRNVDSAPADPAQPLRIGRYEVQQVLGRGGFGIVYLAYDDQLDRPVAVKVPHRARIDGLEDVEQYLAEARIVAGLDHPGIVPVYDVGRTEAGLCYVVSKYIKGGDLRTRLRAGRLACAASAELVAVIAEALHHAHVRGVVHRDVKPNNILVDSTGNPYVCDFGLAIREEDFGEGLPFAGTPALHESRTGSGRRPPRRWAFGRF